MTEANQQVLRQWYEQVWNRGNFAAIRSLRTEDAISHGLSDRASLIGSEGFQAFYDACRAGLSGIHITVDQLHSHDDLVAQRCTMRGFHRGRAFSTVGGGIARVRNGRIAEAWNLWDVPGLIAQIGPVVTSGALFEVVETLRSQSVSARLPRVG